MVKARQRGVYWLTVGPEPYLVTCQRCGKREVPPELPTPLAAAILYMQHLVAKHRHCQPVEEAPAVQVNET